MIFLRPPNVYNTRIDLLIALVASLDRVLLIIMPGFSVTKAIVRHD